MKKLIIVTNNPCVKEKYENVYFVKGDSEKLLLKVRDMIYEGHELISHPLGASLRMMFSPYHSVIVTEEIVLLNEFHVEIISKSIENYKNTMGVRKEDIKNANDYARIDYLLLENAFKEGMSFFY